jgi:hypothetical protein
MMILQRYQIATMALLIGSVSHTAEENTSMGNKVMADSLLPAVIYPRALIPNTAA